MWWNIKDKDIKSDKIITEVSLEPELEPEEEWIWVEGYKGVDINMQGYNNFQYEVGVEYSTDEPIKECLNGFHFSLKLQDAFLYKDCINNKFFKVKAYVKKEAYEQYGHYNYDIYTLSSSRVDKLVSKKIILIDEIPIDEEFLKAVNYRYPEVNTWDDYMCAHTIGYIPFVKNKYKAILGNHFSELFFELFFDKFGNDFDILKRKTKEALAYIEEGIAKDVMVYLLMK